VFLSHHTEAINGRIAEAQLESSRTCEVCGKPGRHSCASIGVSTNATVNMVKVSVLLGKDLDGWPRLDLLPVLLGQLGVNCALMLVGALLANSPYLRTMAGNSFL
jgi:hypothetical protein